MQERDEFLGVLTQTGTNPEQYAQTLDFLQLFNSDKREDRVAALKRAQETVAMLAISLGEDVPGLDTLAQFPDLQQEVEAGDMPEARAKEIAIARLQKKQAQSIIEKQASVQETEQQTTALVQTGKTQLTTFETQVMSDPKVAEAYKVMRPNFIATLRPILRRTHPSAWGEVAQELFLGMAKNFVTAPTLPVPPVPKNKPLRVTRGAGAGSSGTQKEPKSALDAINFALTDL